MYYGMIKKSDIADGTGVRVSLFVSGCTHHCKGCFNEMTWDFQYGQPYTEQTEDEILSALSPSYISGLTLLGGEPFELSNQPPLAKLVTRVRNELPNKTIWAYTGFIYDKDLITGGRRYTEYTDTILNSLDILVDGPFIEEQKSLRLKFRGSSNQRIIDMPASRTAGVVILSELNN